jgi:hypothetical protein
MRFILLVFWLMLRGEAEREKQSEKSRVEGSAGIIGNNKAGN